MNKANAEDALKTWEKSLAKADLDVLQRERLSRRQARSHVSKSVNSLYDTLNNPNVDDVSVSYCLEKVLKALHELELADATFSRILMDDAIYEADVFLGKPWHDTATNAIIDGKRKLRELKPVATASAPPVAPAVPSSAVKLPKIELPSFKGESPAEYHGFIAQFDSLMNKSTASNVEKLLYLKGCCVGEAKKIADGFPCTDANYDELYTQLKETYGLPRLVQQSHVQRILELEPFRITTIKPFLNTLESSLRCLGEFKIDPEDLSVLLVPIIEAKMPKEVLVKWRELIHEDTDFSTTKLISFLHERMQCLAPCVTKHDDRPKEPVKDARPKTTAFLALPSKERRHCIFCDRAGHTLAFCHEFAEKPREKKEGFIKDADLCFKCLEPGHIAAECEDPLICKRCQRQHPSILHDREPIQKGKTVATTTHSMNTGSGTILKSFKVKAISIGGCEVIRAMMDDGSQNSWVSKETVDKLQLPIVDRKCFQVGVAFSDTLEPPREFQVARVRLVTNKGKHYVLDALVREGPLCVEMDAVDFDPKKVYPHLQNIKFADNFPRGEESVDLLIGADYCEDIKTGARRKAESLEPVGVHTIFGWVLGGPCSKLTAKKTTCQRISSVAFDGIENEIRRFYEAEQLETHPAMDEEAEESSFRKEVKQAMVYDDKEQQYKVSIPYTKNIQFLGDNRKIAEVMHEKQMKKLAADPDLKDRVKKVFDDQLEMGIIEEITQENDDPTTQKHWLPWHSVIREWHPTTPIRNVMNASQKDKNGYSLNNCQEAGPNLIPDAIGLALQFRDNPIAFMCDISKMFLNIKIDDAQRDLHRFIAFGKVFRQTTLLFGESSSPYLALETVQKHAEVMADRFELAAATVKEKLYIDDTISGAKTTEEAIAVLLELVDFLKSMHLKVHKINSNSEVVLEAMNPQLLENQDVSSILGITWDTKADKLSPKPPLLKSCETKREVLSMLASIYDPLGFHAPLTCKGKMIMQRLWETKWGWDDKIPPAMAAEVSKWLAATEIVVEVPRFWGQIEEVHIFCDASEEAYAAVAYAKAFGCERANLMLAKTRVKPIKETTIPRLELQGASLAAEMLQLLTRQVGLQKTIMWTDSMIVYGWIHSESSKYKVFVGNRIRTIQKTTDPGSWNWVPSSQNPADIPSRGIWPLNEKQKELWLHGPEFIVSGAYPPQPDHSSSPHEELKRTVVQTVAMVPAVPVVDVTRFSNVNRLLNAVCYVFRFAKRKTGGNAPDADERQKALDFIIQIDQKHHFGQDIKNLQEKGFVSKTSSLSPLNPKLSPNGVLLMDGRIQTEPQLVILHQNSHLAELLIWDRHKNNLHSGVSHTLNDLRQRYWIVKGHAKVKATLKKCVTCQKANNRLAAQQMAPLPEWRTTPSPPFAHVGVDYAGPLFVTKSGNVKRYILLFTCGTTRAIHLELTPTLDSKDFLLAFYSFTARRGTPTFVYSDNGSTFQAASKMLVDIKWVFIPPLSPWHGGFWERVVRSVKTPLRKVIGGARIKEAELRTLLHQIEATINSRPLGQIKGIDKNRVITPFDLIAGRPHQPPAAPTHEFAPAKRLQHLEMVRDQFWKQWRRVYIAELQMRPKWMKAKPNMDKGDVVLLKKEGCKRHQWPLARILDTNIGRDGLVRSVKLLSDGKEMIRPIQLIVPLEVQNEVKDDNRDNAEP